MKPCCWLRLLLSASLCCGGAVGQGSSTNLVVGSRSVSVLPDGASCGGAGSVCPAVDGSASTAWPVPSGVGDVSLTVDFNAGPAIMDKFELRTASGTTATIGAITVEVIGDQSTWLTLITSSCNDTYVRIKGNTLYSCVAFNGLGLNDLTVQVPSDQLSIRSSSGMFLWWQAFSRVQITISNISADFNISELSVFGWSVPKLGCNCHPVGVRNVSDPCNTISGVCNCRNPTKAYFNSQCVPSLVSLIPYGPLSGGTTMLLSGAAGTPSQVSVTLGNSYSCVVNTSKSLQDVGIDCVTTRVSATDLYNPLPIVVCWTLANQITACLVLAQQFTYKPDPVITGISPGYGFSFGGINQTITGTNLDSAYLPYVGLAVYVLVDSSPQRYLFDNSNQPPVHVCGTVSSTMLICRSPFVEDSVIGLGTITKTYLEVHMDIERYSNSSNFNTSDKSLLQFAVVPAIDFLMWNPLTQYYNPTYNKDATFDISAQPQEILLGAQATDYTLTVGGQPPQSLSIVYQNQIFFAPPLTEPPASALDQDGGHQVLLGIGYLTFSLGYIKYSYTNPLIAPLVGGLVGGIGGLLVLIGCIVLIVVCVKRIQRKRRDERRLQMQYQQEQYKRYTNPPSIPRRAEEFIEFLDEELKEKVKKCLVDFGRVTLIKEVGRGNFGTVFRGALTSANGGSKETVAIKTLHDKENDFVKRVDFLYEATMMMDFTHKNVLSLRAIAIDEGMPYVILPFMENGDLKSYISNQNNVLLVADLVKFGLQVADGMEYLSLKKFVHRDLAARNCMIDKDSVVKVADFGLARDIYDRDYYRPNDMARQLPIKWMAIESLKDYTFTVETDVWSYGILLWELLTRGKKPYENTNIKYMAEYLKDHRLEKPALAPEIIYSIMCDCWKVIPSDRPTFTDIKQKLTRILAAAESAVTQLPKGSVQTQRPGKDNSSAPPAEPRSGSIQTQRPSRDNSNAPPAEPNGGSVKTQRLGNQNPSASSGSGSIQRLQTQRSQDSRDNSYLVLSHRQTADVDAQYITTGSLSSQTYVEGTDYLH